ncbi:MAG: hypothetical protein WD800_07210 [Dehalococcoidia bacterium]
MRLSDYYSEIVRDGHKGRPTIREARADYRRTLERQINAYRAR